MTLFSVCALVIGIIMGFVWGLDIGACRPAFARGFLRGYYAPWRWVMTKARLLFKEQS